jgi:mRNA-degrading endonuclease RelE of RelBE toxin-antitoxin system
MADALSDVRLAPRVRRDLERIRDKAVLRRLRAAVEGLAVAPYKGGLTAHQGVRSLRVATSGGEFRVLYILHEADRCVLVAMIGPRKDGYDLLKRSELAP